MSQAELDRKLVADVTTLLWEGLLDDANCLCGAEGDKDVCLPHKALAILLHVEVEGANAWDVREGIEEALTE